MQGICTTAHLQWTHAAMLYQYIIWVVIRLNNLFNKPLLSSQFGNNLMARKLSFVKSGKES